jgi:AcrR family transcriptional regulator
MRSIAATDDRSTAARIRDAAITLFAADGVAATSVRAIAAEAGVSAGLVIHHFGSKDGLRIASDEYVAGLIREVKGSAMAAGAGLDPLAAMRSFSGGPPLARYLAKTLIDGSPHVADLVDEMVSDAVGYIATGVEAGLLIPSDHPKERAAILTLWMLGALVLHEHLERLIGFDITGDLAEDPEESGSAYFGPVAEILGGFFTDTTKKLIGEAFPDAPEETKADTEELA